MRSILVVSLALVLGMAAPSSAADAPWGTVRVLGTPAFLGEHAGLRGPFDRVRLLREILRHLHSVPGGRGPDMARLTNAIGALEDVESQLARLGLVQPLVLRPEERNRRTQWQRLFKALGHEAEFAQLGPARIRPIVSDAGRVRLELLAKAGLDVPDFVRRLGAGEPVRLDLPTVELPLPLDLAIWRRSIAKREMTATGLVVALANDVRLAMAYMGFSALDPATLAVFTSNRALIGVAVDHPLAFGEFARSLRVRNGRMSSPGGDAADSVWQHLVTVSPAEPAKFMSRLFALDDGRLAWFYDALAHSEVKTQRYALGTWLPAKARNREAWATYEWFQLYVGDPDLLVTPFRRSSFDPALALQAVELRDSGDPLPPSAAFIEDVLANVDLDRRVPQPIAPPAPDDALTANRFLSLVFGPGDSQRARAETIAFVQRLLQYVPSADPQDLAAAAIGHLRFPALAKTLERWPIARLAPLVAAVRRAEYFRHANPLAAYVGLMQFQSGLGLIHASRRSGAIDGPMADRLAEELSVLAPDADGRYRGVIAQWFAESFLPKLRAASDASADLPDSRVLRAALAGRAGAPGPEVEWHARRYSLDVAGPAETRIQAGWDLWLGVSPDALVAFGRLPDRLARARTLEEVEALRKDLAAFGPAFAAIVPPAADGRRLASVEARLADITETLASVRQVNQISRAQRLSDDMADLVDLVMAHALPAMVYAAFADATRVPMDAQAARRHDLGVLRSHETGRAVVPWSVPIALREAVVLWFCGPSGALTACGRLVQSRPDVPWHVDGSLLGLDLVFGRDVASASASDGLVNQASIADADLAAIVAATVSRSEAREPTNDQMSAIAAAVARGRDRIRESPVEFHTRLGARFAALLWAAAHEPDAMLRLVSTADLLAIGTSGGAGTPTDLDDWGGSSASVTGCHCARFVSGAMRDLLEPYRDQGLLSVVAADLELRLAELLAEARLPASIRAHVRGALTDRVLQRTRLDEGDWARFSAALAAISAADLEAAIDGLVSSGVLRAVVGAVVER